MREYFSDNLVTSAGLFLNLVEFKSISSKMFSKSSLLSVPMVLIGVWYILYFHKYHELHVHYLTNLSLDEWGF